MTIIHTVDDVCFGSSSGVLCAFDETGGVAFATWVTIVVLVIGGRTGESVRLFRSGLVSVCTGGSVIVARCSFLAKEQG